MAIEAYTGLPGSGKSYSVVEHVIVPSIREGRVVVTNIPLVRDALLGLYGVEGSDIVQLPDGWDGDDELVERFPHGAVVVLDEVWRRWPSGLKAMAARQADKAFLAEHRHLVDEKDRSTRVVLVTQDLQQVSAWVRALVQTTYRTTKLNAVGATTRYRVDVYQGAVTGQRPAASQRLRTEFGAYKAEIFELYCSATKSKTGRVGDESTADGRAVVWRSTKFRLLVLAMVVLPIFASFTGWRSYQSFAGVDTRESLEPRDSVREEVTPPAPVAPARVPVAPAGVLVQVATEPALSRYWRVAAVVWRENGSGLVVLDSPTGQRTVPVDLCEQFAGGVDWFCDVDGERVTGWSGQPDRGSVWRENAYAPGQVDGPGMSERFDSDGLLRRARAVEGPGSGVVAGRDVPVTRLAE